MALTKTLTEDKIEVVGDYKIIQIRTATIIKDDGVAISRSYSRTSIQPGFIDASDNWVDTDVSGQSAEVRGISAAVWTQAVKDAYKAKLIADQSSTI